MTNLNYTPTTNHLIAKSFYDRNNLEYHNWNHVLDMIARIPNELQDNQKKTLIEGIVWHDSVYHPGASNNEERSAELYVMNLLSDPNYQNDHIVWGFEAGKHVKDLILSTEKHVPVTPGDMLQEIIIDLDLFGLSLDWPEYINNGKKIFAEYKTNEYHWRTPRQLWVEKFLAKDRIYHSGFFANRELRARYNLEKELYMLKNKVSFIEQ